MRRTIISLILLLFMVEVVAAQTKKITMEELEDKIAGAWIGQMIGNIYGLPHENKYVDAPGPENWPYGYSKNLDKLERYDGAFSDDDTDVEYMYLIQMEKYGVSPTYENLREAWMYHIRDRVWLANRAAVGLMHFGFTPPYTGSKDLNPHWYQIDPQLINEIWAYTAPGMVRYAAQKSDWVARITSDDWGTEPTIHYGAMYAAAFFEKDINKLINIGLSQLPPNGRYAQTVRKMQALYKKYPNDWKKAWHEMANEYYVNEPEMTKTIWNANLNGACGILAMLYGKGDFQKTLDLSCAMGFDADNQAATVSGLLGVMYGMKALPKDLYLPIKGWTKPFNDKYINITRHDLPDASIEDIIKRTVEQAVKIVESTGGKKSGSVGKEVLTIKTGVSFNPPVEFCEGPNPRMEIGKLVNYEFYRSPNAKTTLSIVKGNFPKGVIFNNGKLSGTPEEIGKFNITLKMSDGKKDVFKDFELLVRNTNIATAADSIIANIEKLNEEVLDSCWYTFGKPMYAKSVEAIRDGKIKGEGTVFYSLAAKAKLPKVDYYGYLWNEPQTIDMIALHIGCMEEFGGWFTSLNIQYLDENGKWRAAKNQQPIIGLPQTDIVFFQPNFVEYIYEFEPIKTNAIRVIGDAKVQDHWHKYTKNVSSFTSVTELEVYKSK